MLEVFAWFTLLCACSGLWSVFCKDNYVTFTWPDGSTQNFNPFFFGIAVIASLFIYLEPFT